MIGRLSTALWIGIMGTLLIGSSFITDVSRAFWGNDRIWWTHEVMKLPIEETVDRLELSIRGKPLLKHLADGTLLVVDTNGRHSPVASTDITVRLNNWDKIRASILAQTTWSGLGLGISLALLGIGLIQSFRQRRQSR